MKEFISEYGLMILEGIGTIIILQIIYYVLFGNIFGGYIVTLFNSLVGG